MLREGDDFILVISEGPTLAVVPDVTGLSQADAVAALEAQGLVVVETIRDDDNVPAGSVVSWIVTEQPNLLAGSEVLKGTQVAIAISGGPFLGLLGTVVGVMITFAAIAAVSVIPPCSCFCCCHCIHHCCHHCCR